MWSLLDPLRGTGFVPVLVKLLTAMVCGGLIGLEREYKRRPAGFRTHILICLGAAITTLTSEYLYLDLHLYTDVARLGAQVIAGVGFIGAGTIVVTQRRRVKGLTTAAGLWTAAIIGLAIGAGYLECAVFATAMVLFAEIILIKLEPHRGKTAGDLTLYIEYAESDCIDHVVRSIREYKLTLTNLEVTRLSEEGERKYCAILTIHYGREKKPDALITAVQGLPGILCVEEM